MAKSKAVSRKPAPANTDPIEAVRKRPRGNRKAGASESSRPPPENFMRLTVNFPKDLHYKLKVFAAQEQTTIGELIRGWALKHVTPKR